MNVAVRDMLWLNPPWRRSARKALPSAAQRRRPAAPVTRPWEGMAAGLRGALIMASGLVLAGVLGWAWATLTDPALLPIKQVEVQGAFVHVEAREVRDAVAPYVGGNFFTVDVRRLQRVVKALPWVHYAEVRRAWPGTVHITVREQTAAARWGEDALVNESGEIFRPTPASYPADLPVLRGPQGAGKSMVAAYKDMSAMLAPLKLRIAAINLDQRRAWSLQLDNGMQLVLGRGGGYERLLKFVRFYHRAFQGREAEVARVDLRYSNGFAVRWQQGGKHD